MKPVIFGFSGLSLTPEEDVFFRKTSPFGFILFQRNSDNPEQVSELVKRLRECVGREDVPVFIDQEGGRVARLKPPHWPSLPALGKIGKIYAEDEAAGQASMERHCRITANMLGKIGINGNCSPVADLAYVGATDAIGDRAFGDKPENTAFLAKIAVDTFLKNGIFPVVKHMPGHGRATVDPHFELPVVDAEKELLERTDFAPFMALKDAPFGMSCHVVFKSIDENAPVSLSKKAHEIIRKEIGFNGLIMSDDLTMKALKGDMGELAVKALAAGTDIALHCSGNMADMQKIADSLDEAGEDFLEKWRHAKSLLGRMDACYEPTDDERGLESDLDRFKLA